MYMEGVYVNGSGYIFFNGLLLIYNWKEKASQ